MTLSQLLNILTKQTCLTLFLILTLTLFLSVSAPVTL